MSTICIIPARLKSSRFEEKILASWQGKPLLQHVWERARQAKSFDHVWIACDDDKTFQIAKHFGADVKMTSSHHATGSDRIAEALQYTDCDYVVNLQADEPQIEPQLLDALAQIAPQADCSTLITDLNPQDAQNPNHVKVVIDRRWRALYFSRNLHYGYKHIGIYAYKRAALFRFLDMPRGEWEKKENLEQLRLLEAGMSIQTLWTSYKGISIDTPEDFKRLQESTHV